MVYKTIEIATSKDVLEQPVKTSHFYKGFSTVGDDQSVQLFDFELIKQDIVNHFRTRKGERVMNPGFGSIIWDLLMEPLSDESREVLKEDVKTICNFDPRVTPIQMDITEYDNGFLLELTLQLKGTDQSTNLKLAFDQQLGLIVQ